MHKINAYTENPYWMADMFIPVGLVSHGEGSTLGL